MEKYKSWRLRLPETERAEGPILERSGVMSRSDSRIAFLFFVCSFAAVVFIFTTVYLYSQNTIVQNGKWINTKFMLRISVMGSGDFFFDRVALHRNRLNLDAWHSFNEVTFLKVFTPKSIRFRFRLEEGAYLNGIFNRTPLGFSGVRLSRNPRFETMFFRSKNEKFIDEEPLKHVEIGEGWHYCELEFVDGQLVIRLDQIGIGSVKEAANTAQVVGFRNGYRAAWVDDFEVVTDKNEVIRDSFSHSEEWSQTAIKIALALLLLWSPFIIIGIKRKNTEGIRNLIIGITASNCILIVFGAIYYSFDYFYWSQIYFKEPKWSGRSHSHLALEMENFRSHIFNGLLPRLLSSAPKKDPEVPGFVRDSIITQGTQTRGPVKEYVLFSSVPSEKIRFFKWEEINTLPSKNPGTFRVVLVGTSQTRGSGAESMEGTIAGQFQEGLSNALPELKSLETLNLSVNGASPTEQIERYRDYIPFISPDLVILNFSNNGSSDDLLEESLREFVELNQAHGAKTILLKEANSEERNTEWILRRHERVSKVGLETNSPVLDLHGFMNNKEIYDSGFLWWDWVHMSTFGQKVAAQWLVSQLAPYIKNTFLRKQPANDRKGFFVPGRTPNRSVQLSGRVNDLGLSERPLLRMIEEKKELETGQNSLENPDFRIN